MCRDEVLVLVQLVNRFSETIPIVRTVLIRVLLTECCHAKVLDPVVFIVCIDMVDCLSLRESGGVLVKFERHHDQLGNRGIFPSDSFFVQSHFLVLVVVHVRFERLGSLAVPVHHAVTADLIRVSIRSRTVLEIMHIIHTVTVQSVPCHANAVFKPQHVSESHIHINESHQLSYRLHGYTLTRSMALYVFPCKIPNVSFESFDMK